MNLDKNLPCTSLLGLAPSAVNYSELTCIHHTFHINLATVLSLWQIYTYFCYGKNFILIIR